MGCAGSSEDAEMDTRLPTSSASRCVVLLVPPAFDVSNFMKGFPAGFDYKFLSVGKLIRDEINKNTQYSQVILQNLEERKRLGQTDKHVNEAILEILLHNIIFQGNFIIQFCPKKEELSIWKRFVKMVDFKLAAIITPEDVDPDTLAKPAYPSKLKEFEANKQRVYDIFAKDKILQVSEGQANSAIYERLQKIAPA